MLENERAAKIAVAAEAPGFVSRHRLHVARQEGAVRIVAIDAVHDAPLSFALAGMTVRVGAGRPPRVDRRPGRRDSAYTRLLYPAGLGFPCRLRADAVEV